VLDDRWLVGPRRQPNVRVEANWHDRGVPAVQADRREVAYLDVSSAALKFARAAVFVGLLYAAISVYWGLGGTWLLNTVGGSLQKRAGDASVVAAGVGGRPLEGRSLPCYRCGSYAREAAQGRSASFVS